MWIKIIKIFTLVVLWDFFVKYYFIFNRCFLNFQKYNPVLSGLEKNSVDTNYQIVNWN